MSLGRLQYLMTEIQLLKHQNCLMSFLISDHGFDKAIELKLVDFKFDKKTAFDYINLQYESLFGQKRFVDFAEYQAKQSAPDKSVTLTRNFLKQWFATRGFDAWVSFSPLVLHYYPEIGAARLRAFWDGKNYDAETVKLVDYVKQIIG